MTQSRRPVALLLLKKKVEELQAGEMCVRTLVELVVSPIPGVGC